MANLKTDYKDDVLDTSVNTKRRYNMITNADGTVSFEDVTAYLQNGDIFGAADINSVNVAANHAQNALGGVSFVALRQAEYDALTVKDSNTVYLTTE